MTQYEYSVICDALQQGVPVLSHHLIDALNTLIKDNAVMIKKLKKSEKEKENK